MKPYFETELGKLYYGDCLEILSEMYAGDVASYVIVSDPPWNVGKDFGICKDKWTKEAYISFIEKLKLSWGNRICLILSNRNESFLPWLNVYSNAKIIICEIGASIQTKINNLRLQWKPILTTCMANSIERDLWHGIRWNEEGYYFDEPRYNHPAIKSVNLMEKCIVLLSEERDVICDPFLGSGTTAIACEKLHRHWIGIEINKEYCDIAVERLKKETNQFKLGL